MNNADVFEKNDGFCICDAGIVSFVAVGLVAASAHSQGRESALAGPRVRTHF